MTITDFEKEDIMSYKKKTRSNTSKSYHKSDHKHDYKDIILTTDNLAAIASVCTICGKVYNTIHPTEKISNGTYRELTKEEVLTKYKRLDIVSVEDLYTEYIPISKGG